MLFHKYNGQVYDELVVSLGITYADVVLTIIVVHATWSGTFTVFIVILLPFLMISILPQSIYITLSHPSRVPANHVSKTVLAVIVVPEISKITPFILVLFSQNAATTQSLI